jgi:hypothetical protein
MKICEVEKPLTPDQQKVDQLKATSQRASDALKIERERQKAKRAQQTLQKLRSPSLKPSG